MNFADHSCIYFSIRYDPTIESTHHKTIRFRKVHFATDIVDTAGMVSLNGCHLIVISHDNDCAVQLEIRV
jgi:Ras homolog enriched in brain